MTVSTSTTVKVVEGYVKKTIRPTSRGEMTNRVNERANPLVLSQK
jgi:hypothetical protein